MRTLERCSIRTLTRWCLSWTPGGVGATGRGRGCPSGGSDVNQLSLGVVARSFKENERRLPLHPHHLGRIPDDLRESVYLEHGYGDRYGMSDAQLKGWVAGFRTRERLVEECDVILQPKPLLGDIAAMRVGQVLWGGRTACRTRSSHRWPSTGNSHSSHS